MVCSYCSFSCCKFAAASFALLIPSSTVLAIDAGSTTGIAATALKEDSATNKHI